MADLDVDPMPSAEVPRIAAAQTPAEARSGGGLRGGAMLMGSAGLLLAMATDALAVAGRHFGFTVLGSIEIFEACIVVAATAAILVATLDAGHARVRILLERLRQDRVDRIERAADGVAALVFILFAAGSAWLAADLWGGHEITEVLGLPLRWFRAVWIVGCLACTAIFGRRALGARR